MPNSVRSFRITASAILFLLVCHPGISQIDSTANSVPVEAIQPSVRDSLPESNRYDPTQVKPDWHYVKSYYTDTKAVLKSPFHWHGRDFVKLGLTTGIAVGLYSVDQRIRDWSQERKTPFTTRLSEIVDPLGNGRYLVITSGLVFLHGQLFKNEKSTRVGLLILESQLINGVLGQVVKILTSRVRPRDGGRYNDWEGPNFTPNFSFPSGHAQTVFALMTVVAMEYRDVKVVPPIAYTLAVLTSLSRINQDAHWASDVFVGAVLGHFISKTIVQQHTKPDNRLGLSPWGNGRTNGLSLSYRF